MNYRHISVLRDERVGVIKMQRPQTLNALNLELMQEVVEAAVQMDKDPGVGAILLTGSDAVFAAGADIKEMSPKSFVDMYMADWFQGWDELAAVRTPLIAAVSGFALGGGCELAMMCDFILAADNAQFGQPEIRLGVIPGMGGSQRLTQAIGKSKAMEMILTGRTIGADEAERIGLVARVIPHDKYWEESLGTAHQIATKSLRLTCSPKKQSKQPSRPPWTAASCSSAAFPTPYSQRQTRRKECRPSWSIHTQLTQPSHTAQARGHTCG